MPLGVPFVCAVHTQLLPTRLRGSVIFSRVLLWSYNVAFKYIYRQIVPVLKKFNVVENVTYSVEIVHQIGFFPCKQKHGNVL